MVRNHTSVEEEEEDYYAATPRLSQPATNFADTLGLGILSSPSSVPAHGQDYSRDSDQRYNQDYTQGTEQSLGPQARRRSERNPFNKTSRERQKPAIRTRHNLDWGVFPEKFWLANKVTKREQWASRIIWIGMVLGVLATIGFGVWGYFEAALPDTCMLMTDDFRYGTIDQNTWKYEISTGGGNAGSFEWTTNSAENAFVKDGMLHLRPTLNTNVYEEGQTVNLTTDGTCTSPYFWCNATQNATAGTVINPVFSAQLSTKVTMQYGSAEIRVKFPKGDWLWSQLILNPSDNYYGSYPANGQIVIAQNRGNDASYAQGGSDNVDSFLAFGPDGRQGLGKTLSANKRLKFKDYSDGFHVFGIQWTPRHIRTWVDDPVNTMLLTQWYKFGGFYEKGGFEKLAYTGGNVFNPWAPAYPSLAAPFDRPFYLTLQLGVGGMNGIFNVDQPWQLTEGRQKALAEFKSANTSWYPQWPTGDDRDMIVDYVKMRRQCVVDPVGL